MGDIACDPNDPNFNGLNGTADFCHMKQTSDKALELSPDAVLILGDVQYEVGAFDAFMASYDPTWGRLKGITHPVPGNHEYGSDPNAAGYFDYFGSAAGVRPSGYYSFDLGAWHVIALNSNCAAVGGCDASSPQGQWLREDLRQHWQSCILAFWHHPLFSSGGHGSDTNTKAFWDPLYAAGAELILNGHEHFYERYGPQTSVGDSDLGYGVRQITAGTGGKSKYGFINIQNNSEARASAFGVLELHLDPGGYSWQFHGETGEPYSDSGSNQCHLPREPYQS